MIFRRAYLLLIKRNKKKFPRGKIIIIFFIIAGTSMREKKTGN